MPRLIDRIYDQIPPRLRGRFRIRIVSDPYHLRVEVIAKTADGIEYSSGPIEVEWDGNKLTRCDLPDWFISHMCSVPAGRIPLYTDLWDSLADLEQ
jgi:hypothetical protein